MEEDQAVKFIERMFSHAASDRMAILAIPRSEGKAEQRVFTLSQATSRKVQAWLRHLNARDYDIYLCVNPVRPGSGGREKGDIAEIRRLQLDLDIVGHQRQFSVEIPLQTEKQAPKPSEHGRVSRLRPNQQLAHPS